MEQDAMINTIELHVNMSLRDLFQQRGWNNPSRLRVEAETTVLALLSSLDIPHHEVGVVYINGKAYSPSVATIRPGDRVAIFSTPMFMALGPQARPIAS
jgi:sulfur carrier protein ThiS